MSQVELLSGNLYGRAGMVRLSYDERTALIGGAYELAAYYRSSSPREYFGRISKAVKRYPWANRP